MQGLRGIRDKSILRCRTLLFWLHVGIPLLPALESFHSELIEMSSPDHKLIGLEDVIHRRRLAA